MFKLLRSGDEQPFSFDEAMRRLVYLMGIGCGLVLIYAICVGACFWITVSLGLMLASAAAVAAGLIGFIFGVPYYSRDGAPGPQPNAAAERLGDVEVAPSTYRPNTSLEQISDWLTKMLVGAGLVEIKSAPHILRRLVGYLAPALGGGDRADVFVLGVLVFFAVCGFLFGFLWARLYLRRWFSDADRDLVTKLSKFQMDGHAIALAMQQINRSPDEDPASEAILHKAFAKASAAAKAQIFALAQAASNETGAENYDVKNQSAVSILRALIADDKRKADHKYYSELSYALTRARAPDHAAGEAVMTEAINRRNAGRLKGWRYYEFRRARDRIMQDENFRQGRASDLKVAEGILADLDVAFKDPDKWPNWIQSHKDVPAWITLNQVQARFKPT
jgi:hypothetical protein